MAQRMTWQSRRRVNRSRHWIFTLLHAVKTNEFMRCFRASRAEMVVLAGGRKFADCRVPAGGLTPADD